MKWKGLFDPWPPLRESGRLYSIIEPDLGKFILLSVGIWNDLINREGIPKYSKTDLLCFVVPIVDTYIHVNNWNVNISWHMSFFQQKKLHEKRTEISDSHFWIFMDNTHKEIVLSTVYKYNLVVVHVYVIIISFCTENHFNIKWYCYENVKSFQIFFFTPLLLHKYNVGYSQVYHQQRIQSMQAFTVYKCEQSIPCIWLLLVLVLFCGIKTHIHIPYIEYPYKKYFSNVNMRCYIHVQFQTWSIKFHCVLVSKYYKLHPWDSWFVHHIWVINVCV